ncbi:hypothetical protein INT44_000379 [Umbelopsis vinacea]|uniref:Uncharacterized protein n=1 Tax=Umbelopsis vinacea TaxID=44442 RepID=A0A8H7PL43_9FUNG|nr:hypothetical protein INT44_000379 [Umbelopsis vinacea]
MDAVISYRNNTLFGTANITSDIPDLGAIDKDYIFVMESHRDAGPDGARSHLMSHIRSNDMVYTDTSACTRSIEWTAVATPDAVVFSWQEDM